MKLFTRLFFFVLLFQYSCNAMSDASELGLTAASAIMDSKNVANGLKNVAKDQTAEWMWDSVGGLEKIILQNNEAELKEATSKLVDIANIIQSINNISISIANGKYDAAAIEAVDQVVGAIDHPLVTAMWSAVKLTYESHKLVISTEDALQVEILYNIVNHDRMLLGVSNPESKEPPQIPISSKTADYFFDKYIMTNDTARRALKSYVTTVLNQEWPEQSWSEWIGNFRTIGMGIDNKKNAELKQLDTKWRNKGRTWVIAVIKDINKQARESWAKLKLRQEIARFKKFAQRVAIFKNQDLPQMLKEFKEIEQYKKELPQYKLDVAKSKNIREKIEKKISSFDAKSFLGNSKNRVLGLRNISESWRSKMMSIGSKARLLRKKSLATQCDFEMNAWIKIINKIDMFIEKKSTAIAQKVSHKEFEINTSYNQSYDYSPRQKAQIEKIKTYSQRFILSYEKLIKPMKWDFKIPEIYYKGTRRIEISSNPKEFASQLLKVLNQADTWKTNMWLALKMYNTWMSYAKENFYIHISPYKRAYLNGEMNLGKPPSINPEDYEAGKGWEIAKAVLVAKLRVLYPLEKQKFENSIAPINKLINSFSNLHTQRIKQYHLYSSAISQILKYYNEVHYADVKGYSKSYQECVNNSYTKLPRLDSDTDKNSFLNLPWILTQKARSIRHGSYCLSEDGIIEAMLKFKGDIRNIKDLLRDFDKLPALTEEDVKQIEIFVQPKMKLSEQLKQVHTIKSELYKLEEIVLYLHKEIPVSRSDIENRQKDAYWLNEKSKYVESYINFLINSGKVKKAPNPQLPGYGLKIIFPKNIRLKNGMLFSLKPQPHYLNAQEIHQMSIPYKALYTNSPIVNFLKSYFPKVSRGLEDFLSFKHIQIAQNNIIVLDKTVYKKDLDNLKKKLSLVKINDSSFDEKINDIPKCFPNVKTFRKFYFEDIYIDKKILSLSSLGKEFLQLREKIQNLLLQRRAFLIKKRQEQDIARSEKNAKDINEKSYNKAVINVEKINKDKQKIQEFYTNFKEAYESKDIASVTASLSDDWSSSSDGTDMSDLEDYLSKSFRVFDEISYKITDLNIQPLSDSKYRVSYTVNIVGQIYDDDITHEEKSSVQEEVGIKDGKVLILKTFGGRYWSIK